MTHKSHQPPLLKRNEVTIHIPCSSSSPSDLYHPPFSLSSYLSQPFCRGSSTYVNYVFGRCNEKNSGSARLNIGWDSTFLTQSLGRHLTENLGMQYFGSLFFLHAISSESYESCTQSSKYRDDLTLQTIQNHTSKRGKMVRKFCVMFHKCSIIVFNYGWKFGIYSWMLHLAPIAESHDQFFESEIFSGKRHAIKREKRLMPN